MRIFLVGGTGFIGRGVLPLLLQDGHSITALVRPGSLNKLKPGEHPNLKIIRGDALQSETYIDELKRKRIDAVINLVGILREKRRKGITFQKIHIDVVKNLLELAQNLGIKKFIHVSANGARKEGTPYQKTKWEAERLIKESGIDFTIIRPSVVLGDDPDVYNFASVLDELLKFPIVPLPGGGKFLLQPVERKEVSLWILRALKDTKLTNRIIPLCGKDVLTFAELIKRKAKEKGLKRAYIPIPLAFLKIGARLFGNFDWFPIGRDEIKMLEEGNVCPEKVV